MDEFYIFNTLLIGFGLSSVVFLIVLSVITAGYGQHINKKWGPAISNNKLGWFIMELPTIIIYFIFYFLSDRKIEVVPLVFLFLWMFHYFRRTLIFPLLIRGKQPMPISIILMGFTFNGINTYLQARWIYNFSPIYPIIWLFNPIFILGVIIFFCGYFINFQSDLIIHNLRKPGETAYKIPYGGMFKYVSSPTYLGEIIEWTGWALMTWSLSGLIFAAWTFANLAPRARSHHLWYIKTFPDYPKNRKALIPFIF